MFLVAFFTVRNLSELSLSLSVMVFPLVWVSNKFSFILGFIFNVYCSKNTKRKSRLTSVNVGFLVSSLRSTEGVKFQ